MCLLIYYFLNFYVSILLSVNVSYISTQYKTYLNIKIHLLGTLSRLVIRFHWKHLVCQIIAKIKRNYYFFSKTSDSKLVLAHWRVFIVSSSMIISPRWMILWRVFVEINWGRKERRRLRIIQLQSFWHVGNYFNLNNLYNRTWDFDRICFYPNLGNFRAT